MEKSELIYEGKAKKVFLTNNSQSVLIYYKDDATAFNAQKRGTVLDKGVINNEITSLIFEYLSNNNIKTHFIERVSDREQICKKVTIFPIEVIIRNLIAGSTARLLGLEEGTKLNCPIIEFCYKRDDLGDPLINDFHIMALGLATEKELSEIKEITFKINTLLTEFFENKNLILVDFKIEFGRDSSGNVLLADEISPDTCRLWDSKTLKKLDKDRFRRDLGDVREAYIEILNRIKNNV